MSKRTNIITLVRIPSYRTSDGELFEDKGEAVTHEFKITMRGLFQQHVRADSLSIGQVVDIITKNSGTFKQKIDAHLKVIRGIESQKKLAIQPVKP